MMTRQLAKANPALPSPRLLNHTGTVTRFQRSELPEDSSETQGRCFPGFLFIKVIDL